MGFLFPGAPEVHFEEAEGNKKSASASLLWFLCLPGIPCWDARSESRRISYGLGKNTTRFVVLSVSMLARDPGWGCTQPQASESIGLYRYYGGKRPGLLWFLCLPGIPCWDARSESPISLPREQRRKTKNQQAPACYGFYACPGSSVGDARSESRRISYGLGKNTTRFVVLSVSMFARDSLLGCTQ